MEVFEDDGGRRVGGLTVRETGVVLLSVLSSLDANKPTVEANVALVSDCCNDCFSDILYWYSPFAFPVAAFHAPLINSATPSTPSLFLTEVKSVGPLSRILSASRFITSREAPTYWAMSICEEKGGKSSEQGRAERGREDRTHLVHDEKIRL
jgi:hypothetical protein